MDERSIPMTYSDLEQYRLLLWNNYIINLRTSNGIFNFIGNRILNATEDVWTKDVIV